MVLTAAVAGGGGWGRSPNGVYIQNPLDYPTAILGNKSVEWLKRANVSGDQSNGRPFMLYFASHCPHFPAVRDLTPLPHANYRRHRRFALTPTFLGVGMYYGTI
jgi:hypothetical protein